eukprot:3977889-Ditylum_brightwellii.AAC.1
MADANSPLDNKEFGSFLVDTGLYDLISIQHGISPLNSFIAGRKQIDFILGTYNVAQAVSQGGILSFHEVIVADHRA